MWTHRPKPRPSRTLQPRLPYITNEAGTSTKKLAREAAIVTTSKTTKEAATTTTRVKTADSATSTEDPPQADLSLDEAFLEPPVPRQQRKCYRRPKDAGQCRHDFKEQLRRAIAQFPLTQGPKIEERGAVIHEWMQ